MKLSCLFVDKLAKKAKRKIKGFGYPIREILNLKIRVTRKPKEKRKVL